MREEVQNSVVQSILSLGEIGDSQSGSIDSHIDGLMEVERESSVVGLESVVKLETEKVTELTDANWDGDFLKLAPVKNESLSFHAWFCFSFIFCLLGWYLFSGFSSLLLAWVKNRNLRGRVVPCTLFQISILNSQSTFASIPTFNSTLQSIFNCT